MARARDVVGLECGDPFASVAAKVISARADELLERSEGALNTREIEHLHDMRVASRRLRAAMEVFEPCFPRKRYRAALKEVKAIADALGDRRDRDVAVAALIEFGAKLTATDRHGVLVIIDRLRDEQALANDRLVPFVDRRRLVRLRERIAQLADAAEEVAA
jgi:CHAD domain-containing protein